MSTKYVYSFGGKTADGNGKQKDLLGGKGANLADRGPTPPKMCLIGPPVPPGFPSPPEFSNSYYPNGKSPPADLDAQINAALKKVEEVMGAKFGDAKSPLLLSCRSGARVSMP